MSSGILPQSLEEVGAVLSLPKLHGYCNAEAPVVSIEEHYCAFVLLREEWKNIKQRTWVQKLYLYHLDVQELLCTPVKNFVGWFAVVCICNLMMLLICLSKLFTDKKEETNDLLETRNYSL